jgi:hypothetical protein
VPQLTKIEISPPTITTLIVGGTRTFSATGYDQYGAEIPGLFFVWQTAIGSVNPTSGTQTLFTGTTTPLTGTLTAGYGSITGYATITLQVGTLSYIVIDPGFATLTVGGTRTFTATGYDKYGNGIGGLVWSWQSAIGSVNPTSGTQTLFTGTTTPLTGTLTAGYGSITGMATITIKEPVIQVLSKIVITPETAMVKVGSSTAFTAQGYDQYGTPIQGLSYNWSTNIGNINIGSETSNVTFVAGTKATEGTIAVNCGTITAIATITIVAGEWATFIIAPLIKELHCGLSSGGTKTTILATLSCKDAYGNMVSRQGTWTLYAVFPGGGINPNPGNKLHIPSGNGEFEFSLDINPESYDWNTLTYVVYSKEI